MIASLAEVLAEAKGDQRAAGGFTVYDLATAAGVLRAAERCRRSVIVIVSSQAFAADTGVALVAGIRALAARASVPVALQLDHVSDLAEMRRALDAGVTALMADGSKLPYEDNVALVRSAARLAAGHNATVEGELGRIEGDEEVAVATLTGALTDPQQARDFMQRTGADCLAVSIGNVHGTYREPPQLDWKRLDEVRAATPHPLSLHGASGLPAPDLHTAIRHGIAKINVNTELRERWFATVRQHAETLERGARLLALHDQIAGAIEGVVAAKLETLAGG
jgi:ketose-bisphosphate aldolase